MCVCVCVCVLVTQLCPTLCDSVDCSLPGFYVHGILQARILEWAAIPVSSRSSRPRDQTLVSCIVGRFFTIWATGRHIHKHTHTHTHTHTHIQTPHNRPVSLQGNYLREIKIYVHTNTHTTSRKTETNPYSTRFPVAEVNGKAKWQSSVFYIEMLPTANSILTKTLFKICKLLVYVFGSKACHNFPLFSHLILQIKLWILLVIFNSILFSRIVIKRIKVAYY